MDKVLAIIENSDKILVGKVYPDKVADFGGLEYVFPGGSIEGEESPEEAIVREVREETGLDVKVKRLIGSRKHPKTGKNIHYFYCVSTSTKVFLDDPKNDDLESLKWVEKSKLLDLMPTLFNKVSDFLNIE
jgi:8-oxo-dGTP diphosphatase